jgi:hypothetical protein
LKLSPFYIVCHFVPLFFLSVCVIFLFFFFFAFLQLNEADYDQEILDLILERGLTGRLAGTVLYAPLCERLLSSSQPTSRVEDVARQLVDRNRRSEAGHLLQLTNGLPRYLLNLSTSLYFSRRRL